MARLKANQFEIPTPVQAGAIPPALEGRDVLATAQTGTGKTLSFLIPIVEMLQKPDSQRMEGRGAQALIVLPTRELAMQVEQAFKAVRPSPAYPVALVVGGMNERPQLEALRRGVRLIVATPGRLEDYLKRRLVRLDQVKILVLDEVDRMLDMGFEPAIRRIASMIPKERQTLCYSATLEGKVKEVARNYLKNPVRIEDRLDDEAGRERRTARLQRGCGQEAGASGALAERRDGQLSGVCAHQARRRPGGAAADTLRPCGHPDSRRPFAIATQLGAAQLLPRAGTVCLWPPTLPHAASMWPTLPTWSTSICPKWPRILCIAWAAPAAHRPGGSLQPLPGRAERNDLRKIERALSIQMPHFTVRGVNTGAARDNAA